MPPEQWLHFCATRATPRLFESLKRLDQFDSWSLAAILAHLAELDRRRAAEERGFPSLFAYCTRELGCSEAEAYLRIRAARAAIRYPRILTMIAERRIHLTAVARLAPHLTRENYRGLLDKASRRTLDELARLVASLAPLPEKRPVIRTLSVGPCPARPVQEAGALALPPASSGVAPEGDTAAQEPIASEASKAEPRPMDSAGGLPLHQEGRVLFNFAAPESLRAKFNRARDLLRHKYPHGRPENVFDDALEALLDRKDPDRRIARKKRRALASAGRAGRLFRNCG
ncbi:MAG: hypothetical protein HZB91_14335 [Elusimicrobia bacterium]|nr:hypothetical protein [Elusimicrobiota bacterium]